MSNQTRLSRCLTWGYIDYQGDAHQWWHETQDCLNAIRKAPVQIVALAYQESPNVIMWWWTSLKDQLVFLEDAYA